MRVYMCVVLLFFILLHTSAEYGRAATAQTNSNCTEIVDSIKGPEQDSSSKFIVYRCRMIDDCGGWGDRLSGIGGALFLALATRRKFRIQWDGLDSIVDKDTLSPWKFLSDEVNLSSADSDLLAKVGISNRLSFLEGCVSFPDPACNGLSTDVAVLNVLNSFLFMDSSMWSVFDRYRVIFFHGNRAGSKDWFKDLSTQFGWSLSLERWMQCYYCMWGAIIQPATNVFNTNIHLGGVGVKSLNNISKTLSSPNTCSIAYSFRMSDSMSRNENTLDGWKLPHSVKACITKSIVQLCSYADRTIVYFSSNSVRAQEQVVNQLQSYEVWTLTRHGVSHINAKEINTGLVNIPAAIELSEREAFLDWYVMSLVDVLILQLGSGFSSSAALMTQEKQVLISTSTCLQVQSRDSLCAGRFCSYRLPFTTCSIYSMLDVIIAAAIVLVFIWCVCCTMHLAWPALPANNTTNYHPVQQKEVCKVVFNIPAWW